MSATRTAGRAAISLRSAGNGNTMAGLYGRWTPEARPVLPVSAAAFGSAYQPLRWRSESMCATWWRACQAYIAMLWSRLTGAGIAG